MIEIITDLYIFSFDGRVLEVFDPRGDSKRYHIAYIQDIELKERRKNHRLQINYSSFNYPVMYGTHNDNITELEALVEAIRDKMA